MIAVASFRQHLFGSIFCSAMAVLHGYLLYILSCIKDTDRLWPGAQPVLVPLPEHLPDRRTRPLRDPARSQNPTDRRELREAAHDVPRLGCTRKDVTWRRNRHLGHARRSDSYHLPAIHAANSRCRLTGNPINLADCDLCEARRTLSRPTRLALSSLVALCTSCQESGLLAKTVHYPCPPCANMIDWR
jgi:hypothetical protein